MSAECVTCGRRFHFDVELEDHRLHCYDDYDGEDTW